MSRIYPRSFTYHDTQVVFDKDVTSMCLGAPLAVEEPLLPDMTTIRKNESEASHQIKSTEIKAASGGKDSQGRTALWHAASTGDLDKLGNLALNHPIQLFMTDSDGKSPLIIAAENGEVKAVVFLVNKLESMKSSQLKEIVAAASNNELASTPAQFKKRDAKEDQSVALAYMDYVDNSKWTGIHRGALFGKEAVVDYLKVKGADPNIQDEAGRTPLFRAIEGGDAAVVEYLCSSQDVDVTLPAIYMDPELEGNYSDPERFVEEPNALEHCKKRGDLPISPLDLARIKGDERMIHALEMRLSKE
jgi:ankyrin repeat protein